MVLINKTHLYGHYKLKLVEMKANLMWINGIFFTSKKDNQSCLFSSLLNPIFLEEVNFSLHLSQHPWLHSVKDLPD